MEKSYTVKVYNKDTKFFPELTLDSVVFNHTRRTGLMKRSGSEFWRIPRTGSAYNSQDYFVREDETGFTVSYDLNDLLEPPELTNPAG